MLLASKGPLSAVESIVSAGRQEASAARGP